MHMKKFFIAFMLTSAALLLFGCEKEKLPDETKPMDAPDSTVAKTEPEPSAADKTNPMEAHDSTTAQTEPELNITSVYVTDVTSSDASLTADIDDNLIVDIDSDAHSPESYEVTIIEASGFGAPATYSELRDGFLCHYDNLSFISYEIVSVYAPKEAFELTGDDAFTRRTTLYKAHVFYDHILDKEVDYYMNIAHAGNKEQQLPGVPMYEIGMRFVAAVFGKSDTWRVPVGELEFLLKDENGIDMAYHIFPKPFTFESDNPAIAMDIAESEKQMLFATANNPMIFSSKSEISELGAFIRNDWHSAGVIDME